MREDIAEQIISSANEVHRILGGPGLVESVYEAALYHELSLRQIICQRQIPVPVVYKGVSVRQPLFVDLLVENQIVVEIKATEADNPYYYAQLLTHLRLLKVGSGILINFGKRYLKDGISKICNLPEQFS